MWGDNADVIRIKKDSTDFKGLEEKVLTLEGKVSNIDSTMKCIGDQIYKILKTSNGHNKILLGKLEVPNMDRAIIQVVDDIKDSPYGLSCWS